MSTDFPDDVADELLLAQRQQNRKSDGRLDQWIVELVMLSTKRGRTAR